MATGKGKKILLGLTIKMCISLGNSSTTAVKPEMRPTIRPKKRQQLFWATMRMLSYLNQSGFMKFPIATQVCAYLKESTKLVDRCRVQFHFAHRTAGDFTNF